MQINLQEAIGVDGIKRDHSFGEIKPLRKVLEILRLDLEQVIVVAISIAEIGSIVLRKHKARHVDILQESIQHFIVLALQYV